LTPGQRLLEVSAGTGSNLSLAAGRLGREGRMAGLDISIGMLRQCQRKLAGSIPGVDLVGGDAAHLPFADGAFDAVLHFGAISMFSDKKTAVAEMVRVATAGAREVFGVVVLPPHKRGSLRRRLFLRVNHRYGQAPPTQFIPADATDLHLSWFMAGTCYLIDFVKP
jgi:ubiquinone/menaquinone biosynthesis C-methylase UbiE